MSEPNTTCQCFAAYRFTWPGQNEGYICDHHSQKLRALASAMGLHLQLLAMPQTSDHEPKMCQQKVISHDN